MKKNIVVITGLAGILLGTVITLMFLAFSSSDQSDRKLFSTVTRLEIFSGPVMIKNANSAEFEQVENGFEVSAGMEVRTSPDGRAQVVFANGTVTRLDTNTTIRIEEDSAAPQKIKISILDGQVWSRVAKMGENEYYETVSNSVVTRVKGTSFGHYKLPDGSDKVITTKGEVIGECLNEVQQAVISKDNKVLFNCEAGIAESNEINTQDQGEDWFQFNVEEDTNLSNRFGPYVYNDSNESLLSKLNPKKALKKTADTIGSVLGLSSQEESDTVTTQTPSPTLTQAPLDTPTPISSNDSNNTSNGSNTNKQNPTTAPTNTPVPSSTPIPTNAPVIQPKAIAQIRTSSSGVTITDSVNGTNKQAKTNTTVYPGSIVKTNSTSKAEIIFSNGSVTRLDNGTTVTVAENTDESFDVSILIDAGRIWSRIKKLTGNGENYDTQTDSMVATVRGTSYGHEKDMLNGEPVDKIITVEGEVQGSCLSRNGQKNIQEDKTISVRKNQKGIFKCLKDNPELISDEIVNIDPDDIQWTLENMYMDSQLERSNPEIDYYDPGAAPIDLATIKPELSITASTEATLSEPLQLKGKIEYKGLPFKPLPNSVWTQIDGPRCFGDQPCVIFRKITSLNTQAIFLKEGAYKLQLSSYDHPIFGLNSTTISVEVKGGNEAPVVNAGDDQTITLHKSLDPDQVKKKSKVQFNGRIQDDGIPFFENLTYKWELESGPVSSSEAETIIEEKVKGSKKIYEASFNKSGKYTFKLTADDGEKESSDTVVITVLSPNNPPVVNLGPERTIMLNRGGRVNLNTTSLRPRISDDRYPVRDVSLKWSVTPVQSTENTQCATFISQTDEKTQRPVFQFRCPGEYRIALTASDTMLQASDDMILTVRSYEEGIQIDPALTPSARLYQYSKDNQTGFMATLNNLFDYRFVSYAITYSCESDNEAVCPDGAFSFEPEALLSVEENDISIQIPTETCLENKCYPHQNIRDLKLVMTPYSVIDGNPVAQPSFTTTDVIQNTPPVVKAGADKTVKIIDTVDLYGVVTDSDGPSSAKASWTVVEGPGDVTFTRPLNAVTKATFSDPGIYELKLTGTDGLITISDSVTVIVQEEAIKETTVNAGPDQKVLLTDVVRLEGNAGVTDNSENFTYKWSVDDESVELDSQDKKQTIARFSKEGQYIFTLTVINGDSSESDSVLVEVVENKAPEIGIDSLQTVQVNTPLEMSARITDDEYPAGGELEIKWSKISGPGDVEISDETGPSIVALFTKAGNYILSLLVSDSQKETEKKIEVFVTEPEFDPSTLIISTSPTKEIKNSCILQLNEFAGFSSSSWTPALVAQEFSIPEAQVNLEDIGKTCIAEDSGYSFDIYIEANSVDKIKKIELHTSDDGAFIYKERFGSIKKNGTVITIPVNDISKGSYDIRLYDKDNNQIGLVTKAFEVQE